MATDLSRGELPRHIERRLFLKVSGVLGAGLAAGCARPLAGPSSVGSESTRAGGGLYRATRTEVCMGTFVSVTALHDSRDGAEEAIALAFDEIARLTRVLNRHDERSAVGRLIASGSLALAARALVEVIRSADADRSPVRPTRPAAHPSALSGLDPGGARA